MKSLFKLPLGTVLLAFSLTEGFYASAAKQEPQKEPEEIEYTTEVPDSVATIDTATLQEVVVEVRKPVVQTNGEKVTYNVEDDPQAAGSSLLEMLRKVPNVTIDGEDNIRLNGQSSFKIYVNGKPDPMLSSNPGLVLKSMPASSVRRIEVIKEAGAKYDAEGIGGILNFITVRSQTLKGYAGTVSLGVSTDGVQPAVNARGRIGNVTANAQLVYANNIFQNSPQESYVRDVYPPTDMYSVLESRTTQDFKFHYGGAGVDLSWEPDTLNLFTVNFSWNDMYAKIKRFDESERVYNDVGELIGGYDQILKNGSLGRGSLMAGVSYQHTFNRSGHNLIGSYLFTYGDNSLDLSRQTTESFGIATNVLNALFSSELKREHTFQLDYTLPFSSDRQLLEAGAKMVLRHNNARGWNSSTTDFENIGEEISSSTNTDVMQYQNIGAVYLSWSGTFGKLGTKAGVRYEHTEMGMDFRAGNTPDFSTRLNDLVPNAALSWNFAPMHSLRLAYQMRISRPTLSQVNPFHLTMSNMVFYGNPDLSSEHVNKLTLTYSNFGRVIGGSVDLEYSRVDNAIADYIFSEGMMIHRTYNNLGHNNTTTLSGFLNWNVTRNIRLTANGRVGYTDLKAPDLQIPSRNIVSCGWSGYVGGSFDYTLPWKLHFSASGGKSFKDRSLFNVNDGWYWYGISLSKSFLEKDALRLTLSANNFAQKNRSFRSHTINTTVQTTSCSSNRAWNVGISLTWNFGQLQSQVKKTGAQIDNNDSSGTSGSKTGSIL